MQLDQAFVEQVKDLEREVIAEACMQLIQMSFIGPYAMDSDENTNLRKTINDHFNLGIIGNNVDVPQQWFNTTNEIKEKQKNSKDIKYLTDKLKKIQTEDSNLNKSIKEFTELLDKLTKTGSKDQLKSIDYSLNTNNLSRLSLNPFKIKTPQETLDEAKFLHNHLTTLDPIQKRVTALYQYCEKNDPLKKQFKQLRKISNQLYSLERKLLRRITRIVQKYQEQFLGFVNQNKFDGIKLQGQSIQVTGKLGATPQTKNKKEFFNKLDIFITKANKINFIDQFSKLEAKTLNQPSETNMIGKLYDRFKNRKTI